MNLALQTIKDKINQLEILKKSSKDKIDAFYNKVLIAVGAGALLSSFIPHLFFHLRSLSEEISLGFIVAMSFLLLSLLGGMFMDMMGVFEKIQKRFDQQLGIDKQRLDLMQSIKDIETQKSIISYLDDKNLFTREEHKQFYQDFQLALINKDYSLAADKLEHGLFPFIEHHAKEEEIKQFKYHLGLFQNDHQKEKIMNAL
jgi:hypothetical protein